MNKIASRFIGKHIVLAMSENLENPFTGIPDGDVMFPCDMVPRTFKSQEDAERWAKDDAIADIERIAVADGVKPGIIEDFADVHFICKVERVYRPVPTVSAISISTELKNC